MERENVFRGIIENVGKTFYKREGFNDRMENW